MNKIKRNKSSKNSLQNSLNGINYAIEKEHNLIYIMKILSYKYLVIIIIDSIDKQAIYGGII